MSTTTQIALRVPTDILDRLRAQAQAEFRSTTSLAIALIAQGLAARPMPDRPKDAAA